MIDLTQYGYTQTTPPPDGLTPARVTAVHKERFGLIGPSGELFARLKTGTYYYGGDEVFPTVGDFVWARVIEGSDGLIEKTLPRVSAFVRRDPFAGDQTVAANVDVCFIMTSLNCDFNLRRVERYLVTARQSGAEPVVVLTKADLVADSGEQTRQIAAIAGDAAILPVSAVTGTGLDALDAYLKPAKTAAFLGMSGVGKSSLLNALMGDEVMATKAVRESDSRGRHTTTHRQLFMLPNGAMVIDTPGMRTLGLFDASEGVSEVFADIEDILSRGCKFSNCRHDSEPGCAVKDALESGELDAKRWRNYNQLRGEATYADSRAEYLHNKRTLHVQWKVWERQNKKHGRKNDE